MPPPATRTRASEPAPATSRPAARPPATRAVAPPRLEGKPAVRLSVGTATRRKSGAALVAAETAAGAAPKEPPDPRLTQALGKVRRNAARLKKHDPAKDKADQAQDAAEPPEKERYSRAQGNKVVDIKSEMDSAEKKKPSVDEKPPQEKSFLELLEEEIERVMPKKIEDADRFMNEEDRKNLKGSMAGNIESQKQKVTGPVKAVANNKPDESAVTPKPVITPLPEALPKAATEHVGAGEAMPAPLPDEKVSLQSSKDEAQRRFDENKITPDQLTKANDPRFTAVLKSKEAVDAHADAGPRRYRETEQKTLSTAVGRAVAAERRDMGAMLSTHGKKGGDVKAHQSQAMLDDKAARQKVVNDIEKKFNETKDAVEKKLSTLEGDVTRMFDEGIGQAITSMKDEATRKKDDWKEDRYYWHGIMNRPDLWAYDKLKGIDHQPKIKKIYVEAAEQFTRDMKYLVKNIAAFVERRLKEAKDEVEKGRKAIHDYVENDLPKGLKDVGRDAEKAVSERFDELVQSIDDKKRDLAQNLAQRYKDAHDKAGEAIKEMQAEDKGLVSAFLDKLKEIIEILSNFRRRVMSMLRKAASAIDLIISDPIGFLENLLSAVKRGVFQFVDHIWEHLKTGFMEWLFGSLAEMGVSLPKDFSVPSILQLVLDVLGITVDKIRGKVAKIIGERNMAILTAAWEVVETLLKGGPAALWEKIREYVSNLKEMVVDAIQDWLIGSIIRSAVTKIAMMFNPVGAIIQAIMMIYRTVMFFIENIDRILDFVEAIIDSVYNIATGAIGSAADWIEKALARTIPIIIGFLARLLGLSGLTEKIRGFILKVQTRIDHAIDKALEKVLGGIKKLFAAGKAVAGRIFEWWKARKKFQADDGQTHSLYYEGTGAGAHLMVASNPESIREFLTKKKRAVNSLADKAKKDELKTKVIPAAEAKLTEIDSAEAALKAADAGSEPARQAQSTSANQVKYDTLEKRLEEAKPLLAKLIFNEKDHPPMRLPTYSDNVLPGGIKAEYVNEPRIKPHRIGGKSNANLHRGHLEGWEQLSLGGLTKNSQWVRMHLFSHRWGGQPTDSNLVPASGPALNIPFRAAFEDIVDKEIVAGKTIWYEAKVTLAHTVNVPPAYRPAFNLSPTQKYMSSFQARWGTYSFNAGAGTFKPEEQGSYPTTPSQPVFPVPGATTVANIHVIGEGPLWSILGSPFTLLEARGLKIGVNALLRSGGRATSPTNLDTQLRALTPPINMGRPMLDRLRALVKANQLTF